MSKSDYFKKGLIALGVGSIIAGGIIFYNEKTRPMTWEEYEATIKAYNVLLGEIRADCTSDVRCIDIKGEKLINFGFITSKKEAKQILDRWIKEREKEPLKYKR